MRFPIIIQKNYCILNAKDKAKLLNSNKQDWNLYIANWKLSLKLSTTTQKTSEIFINNSDIKKFKLQAPIKIPWKKWPGSSISISNSNNNIYISQWVFTLINFLRISTSDAKHLKLKQNQIIQMGIPYKNIKIPNIKVYIKDSFSPELILTTNFAELHWITSPDRANIIQEK